MRAPVQLLTSIRINLRELATCVEERFEEILAPYPPGFYLPTREKPLFKDTETYYIATSVIDPATGLLITGRRTLKLPCVIHDTVLDKNNQTVFSPTIPLDVESMDRAPRFPFRGFNIITDYIESIVYSLLRWNKSAKIEIDEILEKYIKTDLILKDSEDHVPELCLYNVVFKDKVSDAIRDILRDLVIQVIEFMGFRYNDLYTFTKQGMVLTIVSHGDYRIYEYKRLQHQLEELELDFSKDRFEDIASEK